MTTERPPDHEAQPARRFFATLVRTNARGADCGPWFERRADHWFAGLRVGVRPLLNTARTDCGTGLESLDALNAFKWD
jgi:hypothetical protein